MTDNQERAKTELQRYAQLQSELRILQLKHASALDECLPAASWPDRGVVPDEQWPEGQEYKYRDERTGRLVKDGRKYRPIPRSTNRMHGGQILSTVELRRQIETQMRVIHNQMQDLEDLVRQRCDHDDAEVLIRNIFLGQSWTEISELCGISRSTVNRRYLAGLESFGAKMTPNDAK